MSSSRDTHAPHTVDVFGGNAAEVHGAGAGFCFDEFVDLAFELVEFFFGYDIDFFRTESRFTFCME